MNCPVCISFALLPEEHENGLTTHKCEKCSGRWLDFEHYLNWQQKTQKIEKEHISPKGEFVDTLNALICPQCVKILAKFKVSADIDFSIDQCPTCSGVWFDTNEWETIKLHELSNKLHLIFTGPWQKNIKRRLSEKRKIDIYKNKFGEGNFKKINDIKSWLNQQDHKAAMLAYISEERLP